MRKNILFCLTYAMTLSAAAQTHITGFVKDMKGNPVRSVSITLKNTYDGSTTDSTGQFSFRTPEKGNHVLVFTAIGYRPFEQAIELTGRPLQLSISIKEEINEMKAVVITAGAFEASDRKRAAVVLNSLDIVTTASANADITQALKTLPGAQQVGETEGLFVRGGTAEETKIFIDGTLVNRFFYSSGPNIAGYGRFSPFLFKGTVFSAGGYSALYGQALSSAVILESIDLPEQTSASLGISILGLDGGYQKLNKKKNASWGFNASYINLTPAFSVLEQKQDYFKVPSIFSGEGNFRIQTSRSGILKYYGVISTNRLGFTTPSLDSIGYFDRFSLDNIYTYHNLSWKERLGKRWKFIAGLSYANNQDEIRSSLQDDSEKDVLLNGLEFKNFSLKPHANYFNAKMMFERTLGGLSAFRFGSEYNQVRDKVQFTGYNSGSIVSTFREHVNAFFAEADVYLTNALAAKIGTRLERSDYLDRFNMAPRASVAYKLGEGAQASLAYGIFYQNPESKYLPSPNSLGFARASHYIAQYQKVTALRVFRTELFYKKYDNLVKTGFANGRDGIAISNEGFGEAKGIELFWRDKKSIKNFDYWVSYSYLDTERDFMNFPFAVTPNFAAKHTAHLVMKKFVLPWKTGFNMSYNYASSRPYYYIRHDGNEYRFTDRGKVPDYHNVSFSLNYVPSVGKQNARSFAVYVLSVNNIFNIRQTYGYQYAANGYRKEAIVPPSRMFLFLGAFFSFGIDRTEDAINNNL